MNSLRLALLLLFAGFAYLYFTRQSKAEDWPMWRGERGDGASNEKGVPVEWSEHENVKWKTPLPGRGHASPIVSGDRIFIASCLEGAQERILCALDRESGRLLWQKTVLKAPLEGKHELNSFASSTPATDGELIFTTFLDGDRMAVAAHDFAGNEKWLVRPGGFSSKHGYCSCPVVFEDKVIVNGDHDGDAYLVALNKTNGEVAWKIDRENKTRSYSTPIIREIDGRTQMLLSGSKCVASYDPRTGARHWIIDGPTEQYVASMVYNGKLLFMTAGFPDLHMMAIRPDGSGNVTDTHIAWRTQKAASYVPSPIASGDYFLVVSDGGVASCFEAESGKRVWMERMGTHYSASLVGAGSRVYFLADDGKMTVVRPGPTYDVVAINQINEACFASPAISRGNLFIRGDKSLYCIGK